MKSMTILHESAAALAVIAAMLLSSGCATIVSGPRQQITVNSEPGGAAVKITVGGSEVASGTTPFPASVPRVDTDDARCVIEVSKPGYATTAVALKSKMNPMTAGNLVSFFIPGVIVDIGSGAFYEYTTPQVTVALEQVGGQEAGASPEPPPVPAPVPAPSRPKAVPQTPPKAPVSPPPPQMAVPSDDPDAEIKALLEDFDRGLMYLSDLRDRLETLVRERKLDDARKEEILREKGPRTI